MRLGFAGAGNMATAMARGWAHADGGPEEMLFCDLDAERARSLADELAGETREDLPSLAADSDIVILAVKPAALDDAAAGLRESARAVISVLAATPVARLAEALPGIPVMRVMPNQPVEVRSGVLCYVPPADVPPELSEQMVGLLELLGTAVPLEEGLMDAAMAVMSCSPAYVALVAEALATAGTREGLGESLSLQLVAGALAGTAELLSVRDPEAIRRAVAPPGGATEAGLRALDEGDVATDFANAVTASLERFR